MQPQQMQPMNSAEMPGQAMDPAPLQPGNPADTKMPGYHEIMPDKNPDSPINITPPQPDAPVVLPIRPNTMPNQPAPPAAPENPNGMDAYAAANNDNMDLNKVPPAGGAMDMNAAANMLNNKEVIDEDETRKGAAEWVKSQDARTLQITAEEIQKKLGQQPGMEAYKQTM